MNYEYLLSAVSAEGVRDVHAVLAPTAGDARQQLLDRGFADVRLQTDDGARMTSPAQTRSNFFTPAEKARLKSWSPARVRLQIAMKLYRTGWKVWLTGVLIAALAIGTGVWVEAGVCVGVFLVLLPAGVAFLQRPVASKIVALQWMFINAQWAMALSVIPELERSLQKGMAPVSAAIIVTEYRSQALAASGRLNEALSCLDALRARGDVPEYTVLMRTALAYGWAKDRERERACYERMAALDPSQWIAWTALANIYSIDLEQPDKAREMLSNVDLNLVAEDTQLYVRTSQAGIDLAEGRFQAAYEAFAALLTNLQPTLKAQPQGHFIRAKYSALLAITCAKLGRRDEAMMWYKRAEPLLSRHKSTVLLGRARTAIGINKN